MGDAIHGRSVVHIADVRETETYRLRPRFRELVEASRKRTDLNVPLLKDGSVVGVIVVYRRDARPFTDKQIALLQNFAAQAVIAMENARLLTETREALDQQTATAEVLGVISASPGDLAPVFDALLERALRLCDATFGALGTWQGERFEFVAAYGSPGLELLAANGWSPAGSRAGYARMAQADGYVQFADLSASDLYAAGDPMARAAVDIGGARTTLTVPLSDGEEVVGLLIFHRKEVRPFSDQQIALVRNFAAQAVIAMENARLITETREALEQQTATAEVLQVINASPGDLTPVFERILEKAHTLCEAAHGSLITYDGEFFRASALHDMAEPLASRLREPFRSVQGDVRERLLQGEQLIHIPDISALDHRNPEGKAALEAGVRTLLIVPLRKEQALLGYITANRREVRPFNDKQIALLQNFAAQAVIAMENARLITETREALEQQTATAEVLGVINSSPGDLAPIFDAMLDKALRLCDATYGNLLSYDGEFFRVVGVVHGDAHVAARARSRPPFKIIEGSPLCGMVEGRDLEFVEDVRDTASYRLDGQFRQLVDAGGYRSLLNVPLRKEGALAGVIAVFRTERRPFTDKQIALLQNFAAQAVIAMENARLLGELRQRTEEVAELNRGLEARVAEQVDELGRVGRLKRFLAPQLAELIVSHGDEKILESHRREIVVFCDLRGYTAFTQTAEPEEVLDFLREYHGALGPLVSQFEGTLDQFSGDGIMVFFNDPVPCPDPAERAVKMAMAMREEAGKLIATWRQRGRDLGFGVGIAQGYATLGQIGFSERSGYTAIGTVCNVAARLCAEAKDGQILLSQRVNAALAGKIAAEEIGALTLKGLTQPVVAYNVSLAAPALRVIEGGPHGV
jgi:adenylate cyclase